MFAMIEFGSRTSSIGQIEMGMQTNVSRATLLPGTPVKDGCKGESGCGAGGGWMYLLAAPCATALPSGTTRRMPLAARPPSFMLM